MTAPSGRPKLCAVRPGPRLSVGGAPRETWRGGHAVIDPKILEVLVCPACRSPLRLEGERLLCTGSACGLRYPIRDDIPILLIQEAEKPAAGGDKR